VAKVEGFRRICVHHKLTLFILGESQVAEWRRRAPQSLFNSAKNDNFVCGAAAKLEANQHEYEKNDRTEHKLTRA